MFVLTYQQSLIVSKFSSTELLLYGENDQIYKLR